MIGRFLMAALLSAALTVSPPTDTGAPEVSGAGGGDDQLVNVGTLKIAVPCYLIISNFDKVYHMLMFVLKKLPIGIKG